MHPNQQKKHPDHYQHSSSLNRTIMARHGYNTILRRFQRNHHRSHKRSEIPSRSPGDPDTRPPAATSVGASCSIHASSFVSCHCTAHRGHIAGAGAIALKRSRNNGTIEASAPCATVVLLQSSLVSCKIRGHDSVCLLSIAEAEVRLLK